MLLKRKLNLKEGSCPNRNAAGLSRTTGSGGEGWRSTGRAKSRRGIMGYVDFVPRGARDLVEQYEDARRNDNTAGGV